MPQAKNTPPKPAEPPATGPGIQTIVVFGMCIAATVVGVALFGPQEKSDRAFRLLNMAWLQAALNTAMASRA
ncbi:hypothetical protein ABZ468_08020 [Streptomyces sp. NPDC005708]|uniref:hypothetical protein n=1 Tax=Streptomyces sp. NPDC005708 TaxID=3154564 RepID=UPI0033CA39AB